MGGHIDGSINQLTQTTSSKSVNKSSGDAAFVNASTKGNIDETTNYNQFNVASVNLQAGGGIEANVAKGTDLNTLAQQPGMAWVNQLMKWQTDQSGLGPVSSAIVMLVVAVATAGAGTAAAGTAGTSATATAGATAGTGMAGAMGLTAGQTLVLAGAMQAGITTLVGQATISAFNNGGNLAKVFDELGSSQSVKNLLTAMVTGGALAGLNLNPVTGQATTNSGQQLFVDQLAQNVKGGVATALIRTAINGGSLEDALKDSLKTAFLSTIAAQTANEIGDLKLESLANKLAHAIAGCAVGAATAGNGGGCAAGALGAAIGELTAETIGRNDTTVAVAALMSGLAVAAAGGDASQVNLGSQAGGNAAANNYMAHPEQIRDPAVQAKILAAGQDCQGARSCTGVATQAQAQIDLLNDQKIAELCAGNAVCVSDRMLERSVYAGTRDAALGRLDPAAAANAFLSNEVGKSPYSPLQLSEAVTRMQDGSSIEGNPVDEYIRTTLAQNVPLFAAVLGVSIIDGDGGNGKKASVSDAASAQNIANAKRLTQQLKLEAASSPFAANGTLTREAIASARPVPGLSPGELNNPLIPAGFGKYTTPSTQSPSGGFQVHFYMNPKTNEIYYGLDYKAIFNSMSGVKKP